MGARARILCDECDRAGDEEADGREERGGGWPRETGGASLVEETRRGDRTKPLRPPPRPLPSPATALATLHTVSLPPPNVHVVRPTAIFSPTSFNISPRSNRTRSLVYRFSHHRQPQPPDSEHHAIQFRTSIPCSLPLDPPSSSSATQLRTISPAIVRLVPVVTRASLNLSRFSHSNLVALAVSLLMSTHSTWIPPLVSAYTFSCRPRSSPLLSHVLPAPAPC